MGSEMTVKKFWTNFEENKGAVVKPYMLLLALSSAYSLFSHLPIPSPYLFMSRTGLRA